MSLACLELLKHSSQNKEHSVPDPCVSAGVQKAPAHIPTGLRTPRLAEPSGQQRPLALLSPGLLPLAVRQGDPGCEAIALLSPFIGLPSDAP